MKKLLPISLLVVLIDQVVKTIITMNLSLYSSIEVIDNFFNITYVRNTGAAWSILSGNTLLLVFISLMSLVMIYLYFIKDRKLSKIEVISYGLLVGGIIGNLIDRIVRGYVIDYLDFKIIGYSFPIFNIADICIVISIILICINLVVGEYHGKNRNNRRG